MVLTPTNLRDALGHFATGVTVMSVRGDDGQAIGVTANSFVSVSLEPPLVLWCLRREAVVHSVFERNDLFAINFLASQSVINSAQCAARGLNALAADQYSWSGRGVPLMNTSLTSLECKTIRRDDGGDHTIFLARVLDIHAGQQDEPLIFYKGQYRQLEKV